MMKYRIKEKGNKFFPQIKLFVFWIHFKGEPYRYWNEFSGYCTGYEKLRFNSLKESQDFIEEYKNERRVIYHKI